MTDQEYYPLSIKKFTTDVIIARFVMVLFIMLGVLGLIAQWWFIGGSLIIMSFMVYLIYDAAKRHLKKEQGFTSSYK